MIMPVWMILVALCGTPAFVMWGDENTLYEITTVEEYNARVEPESSNMDRAAARLNEIPVINIDSQACQESI